MSADLQKFSGPGWSAFPDSGILMTEDIRVTHSAKTSPIGKPMAIPGMSDAKERAMSWGFDDMLPNFREQLVSENDIVPSLLATKRDILVGGGIMAYTKEYVETAQGRKEVRHEVAIPDVVQAFFEKIDIDEYLETTARNYVMHSIMPVEIIAKKDRQSIASIKALECRHIRSAEMDEEGKIPAWYWSGSWGHRRTEGRGEVKSYRIPIFDRTEDRLAPKSIIVMMDRLLCLDEYYPTPYWWGSEEWIRLANCIPEFHLAMLKNGYSFRVHVQVPKDYFYDNTPLDLDNNVNEASRRTAETAAKLVFVDRLNQVLQGHTKAGKLIITEYEVDKALGKEYPGIKITPISLDLKDEAMLKLFDASNTANMSAQGVAPALANIQMPGKLGSGSEIRNALAMHIILKTPGPRRRMFSPIHLAKRLNGWPADVYYDIRDTLVTNLDEDKSGITTGTEKETAL